MPTFTVYKPPHAAYSVTIGTNGSFTSPYRAAFSGCTSVTRSIAVKRPKPKDLHAATSMTPWSNSGWECQSTMCAPRVVVNSPTSRTVYYDAMSDNYAIDFIDRDSLSSLNTDAVLGNKTAAKIKDGAANIANMLGEYRQAASLFRDLVPRVVAVTLAVARKDRRLFRQAMGFAPKVGVTRASRRAAELLLQWRYGIDPLVDDMHKVMSQLRKPLEKPLYFPVSASVTDAFSKKWFTASRQAVAGKATVLSSGRRRDTLKGYYVLKNDILLNSMGSTGMTNPLSLAWELIPGSFIIDWWFSVGEVLASLDNQLYVKSSVGTVSSRAEYVTAASGWGGTSVARSKTYSRRVYPPPTLARLRYKPSVSAIHVQNGLALLAVGLSSLIPSKR